MGLEEDWSRVREVRADLRAKGVFASTWTS